MITILNTFNLLKLEIGRLIRDLLAKSVPRFVRFNSGFMNLERLNILGIVRITAVVN